MGTLIEKNINGKSLVIINNFLEKSFFNDFKEFVFSAEINWYLEDHMTTNDDYFFLHSFFNKYMIRSINYEKYIIPILKELKFKAISEARANLMLKKEKTYKSNFHTDKFFNCKTAILYMNNCNGYTIFDQTEQFKVDCLENSIVIFDSSIEHCAVSQTDTLKRIVINFNGF
jgi:hypothetical protein